MKALGIAHQSMTDAKVRTAPDAARGQAGRQMGQAATRPVAALTGEEIAPRGAGVEALRQPDGGSAGLRGSIRLAEGRAIITLFGQRNLSTLLHEMGHLWLDEAIRGAGRADAPAAMKADLAATLRSMGIERADQVDVAHHEQWARGFEASRALLSGYQSASAARFQWSGPTQM